MTTNCENYSLGWRDHGANFSNIFNEILRDEELVDVTLAVDGHLFNAHRLVLSALSPYFRKMFKQMPTNQHAFVFLKDVSKQAAEDMLTYIYNGEVNVASECLVDFMNVAKALDIKGLTDDGYSQSREFSGANNTWPNSVFSGMQYQSTHTNNQHLGSTRSLNQTKPAQPQSTESNYLQSTMDEYGGEEDFNYGNSYEMTTHASNMEAGSDRKHEYAANDSYSMNQDDDVSFGQWNDEFGGDSQSVQNVKNVKAPTAKRPKRNVDLSEYTIIADIRMNKDGRQNLFHNGFKHCPKGSGLTKQQWVCTCNKSKKCYSAVSTVQIDGVTMMKVLNGEHTHDPVDEKRFN